jgi:flagellar hook-length control protein FliK
VTVLAAGDSQSGDSKETAAPSERSKDAAMPTNPVIDPAAHVQSSSMATLSVDPATQVLPNHGAVTAASAEAESPGSPAQASPANSRPDFPASTPTGPVQLAHMVNKAAQTEMRIGLNTSAFGNVEVRTVVHANDVGVQIGSERGDLRSLLGNDLPAITNHLQQQNLRLSEVNFHQAGFGSSGNSASGGDSQQRSFTPQPATISQQFSDGVRADATPTPEPRNIARGAGLSILA